jgi:hypothetical protein
MQLPMGFMQEQFLDGQRAAEFLGLPRKTLLNLARRSSVPAHPIGDGMSHTSRFRQAGKVLTLISVLDDPQKQSAAHRESNPKRLRLQLDKRSKSGVLRAYIGALPGDYQGRSDLCFVPFLPPGLPMPGRTKETDMMLNETEAF